MAYDQFGNYSQYPNFQSRQFQQPQPQNVYAFVNGLEGAKQFNINANQSILLMDNAQPVCYLKQANALGQSSLKCFKLVEVAENELSIPQQQVEFATKTDVEAIIKRLEKLEVKGE